MPSEILVTNLLSNNAQVQEAFGNGGEVDLFGSLGVKNTIGTLSGPALFSSLIDLSLATSEASTGNLLVGFLDPFSTGNGFDELRFLMSVNGQTVAEQTFTDLALALAFFDDSVIDIDSSTLGGGEILNLRFELNVLLSSANDGFNLNFLAGTAAVPAPAGIWLLLTALGAVMHRSWRQASRKLQ